MINKCSTTILSPFFLIAFFLICFLQPVSGNPTPQSANLDIATTAVLTKAEAASSSSVNIVGVVSSTNPDGVISYGICWNTTGNPTPTDDHKDLGPLLVATVNIDDVIGSLHGGQKYYFRIYVITIGATVYSNQKDVTLPANHTVSGVILDNNSSPVIGIKVQSTLNNQSVTTGEDGKYSFTVPHGSSTTITPTSDFWGFTPTSKTFANITEDKKQDFLAWARMQEISGRVTDPDGDPLQDIQVNFTYNDSTTFTDPNGNYTQSVPYGTNTTVYPFKAGWEFTPPIRTYSNLQSPQTDQNFTGKPKIYTISGKITDGKNPLETVILYRSDGDTVYPDAQGNYSFTIEHGHSTTIEPMAYGWEFSPKKATFTKVQSDQVQDFTAINAILKISGRVTDGKKPLEYVIMQKSDGGHVTFDAEGNYSFTIIRGDSVSIEPMAFGYSFSPKKANFLNVQSDQTQDFTAVKNFIDVSITSHRNGQTVSGTTLIRTHPTSCQDVLSDPNLPGVDRVEFYLNQTKVKQSTAPPYGWLWDTTRYADGTYEVTVLAYNTIGQKAEKTLQMILDNEADKPVLQVFPQSESLTMNLQGIISPPPDIAVRNAGQGVLNWTAQPDQPWLDCKPRGGTGNGLVSIGAKPTAGMAAGSYRGTITFSAPDAVNPVQKVTIDLTVYSTTQGPFGAFDTPADGSSVRSSIPITGWVLDDIGVESVKIYRRDGSNLFYIGDASFVEGARPDVEQVYPGYPQNSRAGWGYMMLTYFLPNGGNGAFTFTAVATDIEGNQTTLGSKTVISDTNNNVKPFGAIDTPTLGGEASGLSYRNQGWALTPQPNTIPTDGSTIDVFIDGLRTGNPVYNQYRADIANLFPGYANSNGAAAYFDFDTTVYGNGIHTIQWAATDDAGNTDGIGSRYFTITNSGANSPPLPSKIPSQTSVQWLNISNEAVQVIHGFDSDAVPQTVAPDPDGNIHLEIRVGERIEVRFKDPNDDKQYTGYHVCGPRTWPLPPGSYLDGSNGIFYWMPGFGFSGIFHLAFIERDPGGVTKGRFLKITVKPESEGTK
ncbi:Ig-like domain-containing protein [Acidobacteriota bacterium]